MGEIIESILEETARDKNSDRPIEIFVKKWNEKLFRWESEK
jgi:hypothetical protein